MSLFRGVGSDHYYSLHGREYAVLTLVVYASWPLEVLVVRPRAMFEYSGQGTVEPGELSGRSACLLQLPYFLSHLRLPRALKFRMPRGRIFQERSRLQ